jgi:hypothetical protein
MSKRNSGTTENTGITMQSTAIRVLGAATDRKHLGEVLHCDTWGRRLVDWLGDAGGVSSDESSFGRRANLYWPKTHPPLGGNAPQCVQSNFICVSFATYARSHGRAAGGAGGGQVMHRELDGNSSLEEAGTVCIGRTFRRLLGRTSHLHS